MFHFTIALVDCLGSYGFCRTGDTLPPADTEREHPSARSAAAVAALLLKRAKWQHL